MTICPGVTITPLVLNVEKFLSQLLFPEMIGEVQLTMSEFPRQEYVKTIVKMGQFTM